MRLIPPALLSSAVLLSAIAAVMPASAQNAFITNASDNTVSVIDVPSGTVIGAVPVGSEPQGVTVASDGTTAYVTSLFGPSVSVINGAVFPQTVTATIPTGDFPPGVALSPDGTKAYVTNGLTMTPEVSVISTATNTVTTSISLPGTPAGVAVSPDGSMVYALSGTTTGALSVISTASNTIVATIPVNPFPDGIAVAPGGAKAYVTHFPASGTGSVSVINLTNNTVASSITAVNGPIGVAFTPDGKTAFVANNAGNNVTVIDATSDTATNGINVGQGPFGVSFTTDGKTAYVANKTDNTVSQIDVASLSVTGTINVGGAPGAFGSNFVGKPQPASVLLSALLPGGRSVEVGTVATVFATILNTSPNALANCKIVLPSSAPTGETLTYQTTNSANNQPNSGSNPLVTIPGATAAGAGSQSFLLAFNGTSAALDPSQPLLFVCDGTTYAPIFVGLNTIDLQFSGTPVPDVIAESATATNNGIVTVPLTKAEEGAFAVATTNVGVDSTITVTADTGNATLPLGTLICETVTGTGQCMAPPAPSVTLDFAANATPTFSIFIGASAPIPLLPATNRIYVRFEDGSGVSHGSTSVAVETN